MMKTAEQLEKEADEAWVKAFGPNALAGSKPEESEYLAGKVEETPNSKSETRSAGERSNESAGRKAEETPPAGGPEAAAHDGTNWEERYNNSHKLMTQATMDAAQARRELQLAVGQNAELKAALDGMQKQIAELKSQSPGTPGTQDRDTDAELQIDDDGLRQAMEDDPQLVKPLVLQNQRLAKQVDTLSKELEGIKGTVNTSAQAFEEDREQTAKRKHREAIEGRHPDAGTISSTPEFQSWVGNQPPVIQQAVAQGTAADVIYALDLYKQSGEFPGTQEPVDTGDQQTLDAARAAASPRTPKARNGQTNRNRARFTRKQIADMDAATYAKHEAEIDDALARGLIQ